MLRTTFLWPLASILSHLRQAQSVRSYSHHFREIPIRRPCPTNSHPLLISSFFFLGASIHSDLFKRDSVEFDLFRVFFPPGSEDYLASMVNEEVASTRTREQLQNQRHFNGVSGLEMMSWVLERLDLTLNVKNTIKLAYKSVLMASDFTIGSLRLFLRTDPFFPRKPSIARVGCPYPASISSMAILVVMYLRFVVILQRFGRWFGALDPTLWSMRVFTSTSERPHAKCTHFSFLSLVFPLFHSIF